MWEKSVKQALRTTNSLVDVGFAWPNKQIASQIQKIPIPVILVGWNTKFKLIFKNKFLGLIQSITGEVINTQVEHQILIHSIY